MENNITFGMLWSLSIISFSIFPQFFFFFFGTKSKNNYVAF